MQCEIEKRILSVLEEREVMSLSELVCIYNEGLLPACSKSVICAKLHHLKKKGLISSSRRAVYKLNKTEVNDGV